MSSVQTSPEYASRAARLDRILAELLRQTPGVEAAAVVSFDGLPMASALPSDMDEDRVAAMSAALLSLAERASQDLGRGDLSQVFIEGEHGSVFLVSAKDEAVLIAVTAAGAKVGMMLYEVKLAANKVGEALQAPAPLPTPLPSNLTRGYPDAEATQQPADAEVEVDLDDVEEPQSEAFVVQDVAVDEVSGSHHENAEEQPPVEDAAPETAYDEEQDDDSRYVEGAYTPPTYSQPVYAEPVYVAPTYVEPSHSEPVYGAPLHAESLYAESLYDEPQHAEPQHAESQHAEPQHSEPQYAELQQHEVHDPHREPSFGSPLYDQVAHSHTERSDYFANLPPIETERSQPAPWYAVDGDGEAVDDASDKVAEPAAVATDNGWSSYAPSATVLPGEPTTWS